MFTVRNSAVSAGSWLSAKWHMVHVFLSFMKILFEKTVMIKSIVISGVDLKAGVPVAP